MFALDAGQVTKHEGLTTDFQSTALPTELPSRDSRQSCGAVGFSLCNNVVVQQGRVETYVTNMEPCHAERRETSQGMTVRGIGLKNNRRFFAPLRMTFMK